MFTFSSRLPVSTHPTGHILRSEMNKVLSSDIGGLGSKERMFAEDFQSQPSKLPQKPEYRPEPLLKVSEECSTPDTMVLVQGQI